MKQTLQRYFTALFIIIAVLHLCAIIAGSESTRFFTKPLLMLLLAAAVFTLPSSAGRNIIIAALLFSFAGDCFLLYDYLNPSFFIVGLVSFLLTHILYIVYFLRVKPGNASLLAKNPFLWILVIGYGFTLVYILFPHLGALTLPVIVYAVVICSMMLAALHAYNNFSTKAAIMFVTGAALFIASDSMLAINKFMQPFEAASFLIMLTYCAAQYFIVKGFTKTAKS